MELDFEKPLGELTAKIEKLTAKNSGKSTPEITALKRKLTNERKKVYSNLTPWQTVQVARHPNRPLLSSYIEGLCDEFIELHGDRVFGDDNGIVGGFARMGKMRFMLIGHKKGRTVEENIASNFGMANPEGYRKALRLMKLAEKYGLPVVCFVDTPGAYPGLEAEARGQAEAIARNLTEMSVLATPILVVVTGEGGSGGALGIGVGDTILMLSNSVYSVISPEGCASILWRDGTKAPEAAAALKVTANSLKEIGIVDEIIEEPMGGAHRDPDAAVEAVGEAIRRHIKRLKRVGSGRLVDRRYRKYAAIGRFK